MVRWLVGAGLRCFAINTNLKKHLNVLFVYFFVFSKTITFIIIISFDGHHVEWIEFRLL